MGLLAVCTLGLNLYTGKICYALDNKPAYLLECLVVWLGNLVGTAGTGLLIRCTRLTAVVEKGMALCDVKLGDNLLSIFILAIFCNIMIFIGVDGYNKNPHEPGKYLAMFLAIMVFILCGFEHCIANMFYFTMAGVWSGKALLYILVMTLGNAVGGVLIPLCRKYLANA